MTAKEAIEALKDLPEDLVLYAYDGENDIWYEIENIIARTNKKRPNTPDRFVEVAGFYTCAYMFDED